MNNRTLRMIMLTALMFAKGAYAKSEDFTLINAMANNPYFAGQQITMRVTYRYCQGAVGSLVDDKGIPYENADNLDFELSRLSCRTQTTSLGAQPLTFVGNGGYLRVLSVSAEPLSGQQYLGDFTSAPNCGAIDGSLLWAEAATFPFAPDAFREVLPPTTVLNITPRGTISCGS